MTAARKLLLLAPVLALVPSACVETSRFTTAQGESYCGVVTGASFVRAGIAEGTRLRLELDVDALQTEPGRIWTDPLSDGERFAGTRLMAIEQLRHDPLSQLDFGEGRVKNTITLADLGGTQVLVVVSLLTSGDAEVRLIRGTKEAGDASPTTPPQIFGVFHLHKESGDCGLR
jgi:hypothetical protein